MSRRWSDVGRGLVASVGLLALVGGVPAGLALWVGWPLPAEVPRLDEIADALRDTYVPDELLIKALALVCWLVWVELMVSLAVEALAYARGRQAGRVPVATSGIQRAAARLVATAALLGALTATRGGPELASRALHPPPASPLVVAGELAHPSEAAADAGTDDTAAATAAASIAHPVYVVQPRDTLWRIAECHLGDPFRWPEIYELNRGMAQPDGQALRDADLVLPGWRLRLPADATGLGEPAPTPSPPARSKTAAPATTAHGAAAADPGGGTRPTPDGGMILLDESDLRSGGARSAGDRPPPPPDPVGHGGPDGPGGRPDGMVLLPDDALAPDDPPVDDGWVVARGDDE